MPTEHGHQFSIAPRFASALDWRERLHVSSRETPVEQSRISALSWHVASESDLALFVANETAEDAWRRNICLFSIPEHLRAKWWEMAAKQMEALPARPDCMEPFARAVAEFAQFKRMPLPRRCAFDVTLTSPVDEQEASLSPAELIQSSAAGTANSPIVARINLGDEQTALVFSNVGPEEIADASLIRLVLGPGEGVWFPSTELIYSVDRSGKTDLDVWLILKDEGGRMSKSDS